MKYFCVKGLIMKKALIVVFLINIFYIQLAHGSSDVDMEEEDYNTHYAHYDAGESYDTESPEYYNTYYANQGLENSDYSLDGENEDYDSYYMHHKKNKKKHKERKHKHRKIKQSY